MSWESRSRSTPATPTRPTPSRTPSSTPSSAPSSPAPPRSRPADAWWGNSVLRQRHVRDARPSRSVDLDEDALARAFLGRLDRRLFHAGRNVGEPFGAARIGEDLVA